MDEPVTKDFVDREIRHLRDKIDEKFEGAKEVAKVEFKSRDDAIKLLADGVKGQKAVYLAIGLAILALLGEFILKFVVH